MRLRRARTGYAHIESEAVTAGVAAAVVAQMASIAATAAGMFIYSAIRIQFAHWRFKQDWDAAEVLSESIGLAIGAMIWTLIPAVVAGMAHGGAMYRNWRNTAETPRRAGLLAIALAYVALLVSMWPIAVLSVIDRAGLASILAVGSFLLIATPAMVPCAYVAGRAVRRCVLGDEASDAPAATERAP